MSHPKFGTAHVSLLFFQQKTVADGLERQTSGENRAKRRAEGQWQITGLHNAALRRLLKDKSGPQVSRLLKSLRLHGLLKKIGKTYQYYLTKMGQEVLLTALKLRELVVIPALAGLLPA